MDYQKIYNEWLNNPALCKEGKDVLLALQGNEKELEYRFGGEMEFGTAGMRGIIGYGTNMMNIYTVNRDLTRIKGKYPHSSLKCGSFSRTVMTYEGTNLTVSDLKRKIVNRTFIIIFFG